MAQVQIERVKQRINGFLKDHPDIDGHMQTASTKTGVEKAYLMLAGLALPVILLSLMGGAAMLMDVLGFGYPMYQSLKALETTGTEDDRQWLTYWLLFAMLKIFEGATGVLLNMIPFYLLIKAAFLVWCVYPGVHGATTVYNNVIRPFIVPQLGLNSIGVKRSGNGAKAYKIICTVRSITVTSLGVPFDSDGEERGATAEKSLQCAISAVPPPERLSNRTGVEGVVFTSQTMLVKVPISVKVKSSMTDLELPEAETPPSPPTSPKAPDSNPLTPPQTDESAVSTGVNYRSEVKPVNQLDGVLKIDIVEKGTFGSGNASNAAATSADTGINNQKVLGTVGIDISRLEVNKPATTFTDLELQGGGSDDFGIKLNAVVELVEYYEK